MDKKKIIALVGLAAVVLLIGIATAASNTDYRNQITARLERSAMEREGARTLYCEYIGKLTHDCYRKDEEACATLQIEETDYQAEFETAAYQDCFTTPAPGTQLSSGEIVESETGIPEHTEDELTFFGDEEGNQ